VTELAEPFKMSLPAVSKHLRVLERAGLIARSREAQWRPCRLEAGPLKSVADWLEFLPPLLGAQLRPPRILSRRIARKGKKNGRKKVAPPRSRRNPRSRN